ncbi:unnamed protein product [Gordionus sp. m RMFG-2023]
MRPKKIIDEKSSQKNYSLERTPIQTPINGEKKSHEPKIAKSDRQFLDSNRKKMSSYSQNTTFNASMATSFGSSPLFSPFSDESEYIGSPKRLNYMYPKGDSHQEGTSFNSILWLLCIGLSLTFLIFTLITCFLLLYESKSKRPLQ